MNLGRCPVCHARLHLDALVQDEAGRELLAILARLDDATGRALVGYLGLFRPAARDLANDRAVRLAKEALALAEGQPPGALAAAMMEAVATLRAKEGAPLSSHGYLKRVLESQAGRPDSGALAAARPGLEPARSKTLGGIAKLQNMKIDENV